MGPLTALLSSAEPPVTPDPDTARRWLEQELAKPEYHGGPSLLERFLDWLNSLFSGGPDLGISSSWAAVIVVAVVAAVAAAAFLVAGPIRRRAKAEGTGAVLAEDDERTAAQCRAAADDAARAGDWALAVVERFRAVARSLEERAVLDERAGRTAHEFALDAAPRFASLAPDLDRAAGLFDDVCYGGRTASEPDDTFLRDVDRRLAATRPAPAQATAEVPA